MPAVLPTDTQDVAATLPKNDPFYDGGGSKFEFLRPLVTGWLGAISESQEARSGHDAVADQCYNFYSGAMDFMWKSDFAGKYLGGNLSPKFKITLQKAFELVAIFGPVLYWKNPQRTFKPRPQLEISPDMFGVPDDPQAQQIFQEAQMMQAQRASEDNIRNQLMSLVLNYTPDEQPGGGLATHAETAITEALVKGRGVLWPGPYRFPGSNRTLTGCFWDTQDNLFIDPDAKNLDDAWWIARRRTQPTWKVERKFRLPKGSLEGKGNRESRTNYGMGKGNDFARLHRAQGKSNDTMVYWEIYSKMGVGARLPNVKTPMREAFDKVVGDYAYIVVAADVPYPLNAPAKYIRNASDDEVEKLFRWPTPFWRDDRWPCAILDFYRNPARPYPIPPMAPGLGELTYMNIFMSHAANRVWSNSRDFVIMLEQVAEYASVMKSGEDMAHIKIPPGLVKDIREAIAFLEQPQLSPEVWNLQDRMAKNFELRTGLSELLYGLNPGGVQSRTATDIEAKREAISVRPDYMSGKVEQWMSEAADMEKFCARWYVEGRDIVELVGPVGSFLWDKHVVSSDPEVVVREMRAMVEAGSARKPNRSRDAQNMQAVLPVLFPEFSKHADMTTDTSQLNALIAQWGEAIEQPTRNMMLGPRQPAPPPPEVQQQQEQMMQLEQAKLQAEATKTQAEAQSKQIESQVKAMELEGKEPELLEKKLELEMAKLEAEQKLSQDQAAAQQALSQKEDEHEQEIRQAEEKHELEMEHAREEARLKFAAAERDSEIKTETARELGDIKTDTAQQDFKLKRKESEARVKATQTSSDSSK